MNLYERGLEALFFVPRSSPELLMFSRALLSIGQTSDAWKQLRMAETNERMRIEHEQLGGVEQVVAEILTIMGGEEVKFIENRYPYDALLKPSYLHTCLWSKRGALGRGEIVNAVRQEFGDKKALVFINSDERKSIQQIWHSHVIVEDGR
jgi:hypothetical protein